MLYLIPTPIGNKEDITLRALRLLKECTVFLCEDTRTTQKLLSMYEISISGKTLIPYTSYSQESKITQVIEESKEKNIGVISEAGTPGLSDPGKSIVRICREKNIPFEVLPGANALIPTIVACPVDTSSFEFRGFIPQKKGRQTFIKSLGEAKKPIFFYESVHRIEKLMNELEKYELTKKIFISRELSKLFEQKVSGTIQEIKTLIDNKTLVLKGEFVISVF